MTTMEWLVLIAFLLTAGGATWSHTRWGYYGWVVPALLFVVLLLLLTHTITIVM